jgi:site-specific DNA-methyltransferase (adenine-specific)
MAEIQDKSIDLIYTDLPFGTTLCDFDCRIDLNLLWTQYNRIIKPGAAIILHASQPFTSILVCSNIKHFKHEWIWKKSRSGSALTAKYAPVKRHESILVFCNGKVNYYPIMQEGKPYSRNGYKLKTNNHKIGLKEINVNNLGTRYPISILDIKQNWSKQQQVHPTQKPIELAEWFIKSYSRENDLILDSCAGSGTTGLAALNLNRNFILIEKDENYYNLILKRLCAN